MKVRIEDAHVKRATPKSGAKGLENCYAHRETEKAILVTIGAEDHWVPKSIIDDDSEVWEDGQEGTLVVPLWWAEKQGLA